MTTTTKKYFSLILMGLLLGASIFVPFNAFAKSSLLATVCPHIDTVESLAAEKLSSVTKTIIEKRTAREKTFLQKRAVQDLSLNQYRTLEDEKLATLMAELEQHVQTTVEKEAVKNFRREVQTALMIRRSAIDAAIQKNRTAITAALKDRAVQVDAAQEALQETAHAIIADTKAECLTGKLELVGENSIFTKVQTARQQLTTTLKPELFKATLQSIDAVKKESIERALVEYRETTNRLLADLKAVVQ